MGLGSSLLPHEAGELLSLSLATKVSSKLPLGDLEGALVLADLEELDDAPLIGSHACNLANDVANKPHALALELHASKI
jgi:hypothetical protein